MPEPNLPPLRLRYDPASAGDNSGPVNIAAAMKRMKELPDVTRTRLVKNYNLKLETAVVIVVSIVSISITLKAETLLISLHDTEYTRNVGIL